MFDEIFQNFLRSQLEAGLAMAANSDLLRLTPVPGLPPPQSYIIELFCTGLVLEAGVVKEHDRFLVGVHFGDDHLRCPEGRSLVTILEPNNVFHPNVRGPAICVGYQPAAVGLVDLTVQAAAIIAYKTVTMVEWDALNPAACRWARANVDRFPIDTRPLLRPTPRAHSSSDTPGGTR
jgi:hypothetical protein